MPTLDSSEVENTLRVIHIFNIYFSIVGSKAYADNCQTPVSLPVYNDSTKWFQFTSKEATETSRHLQGRIAANDEYIRRRYTCLASD